MKLLWQDSINTYYSHGNELSVSRNITAVKSHDGRWTFNIPNRYLKTNKEYWKEKFKMGDNDEATM